jgi:rSAM/selenodomain-associated transferase 1
MDRRGICAFAVMAKAPQPGRAKTRLCPPLEPAQAAALSAAFLRDITDNIAHAARIVPIRSSVAYAPEGDEGWFDGHLAEGTDLFLADGSPPMPPDVRGLGRCLLHATEVLFAAGFAAVCLVNADSPTLPTAVLVEAARLLLDQGERIVIGPAEDGGYYLLGMTRPYPQLFTGIAWSTSSVAAATRARAAALGLAVVTLQSWYDVDDPRSLGRLLAEIAGPSTHPAPYRAPATRSCLAQLGLGSHLPLAAQ